MQDGLDNLAKQVGHLSASQPLSTSYDALKADAAWVEWADFAARARALIEDARTACASKLATPEELALLAGDAALVSLSGGESPHTRAGQLDTLVVLPNPFNSSACAYDWVRRPIPRGLTRGECWSAGGGSAPSPGIMRTTG